MTAMAILIISALVLISLPIIEGLLIRYTAKDRDRMLELAERMLGSPNYPDEQKDFISDLLDTAMDRKFMAQMAARFPIFVWHRIRGKKLDSSFVSDDKFREILRLHGRSVGAVNPVFDLIFRIEIAIISIMLGFVVTGIVAAALLKKVAHKESGKLASSRNRLNHA